MMASVMLAPVVSAAAPASSPAGQGAPASVAPATPAGPAAASAPEGAGAKAQAGSFQGSLQAALGKPAASESGNKASGPAPAGKAKSGTTPREGEKPRARTTPAEVVLAVAPVPPALVVATGPVPAHPTGTGKVVITSDSSGGLPPERPAVAVTGPEGAGAQNGAGAVFEASQAVGFSPASGGTGQNGVPTATAVTDLPGGKPPEPVAAGPSTPVTDRGAGSPVQAKPAVVRTQAYPATATPEPAKDHVPEGQASPAASAAQNASPPPAASGEALSAGGQHRDGTQNGTAHAGAAAEAPLPAAHAHVAPAGSFDAALAFHQAAGGHAPAPAASAAPAATTNAQPAANARLVDDIYRQIASRSVVEANGEEKVIQVTVNPHHLGEVSVRLTVSGSDVSAHLQVPGAAWQHDVVAHHNELKDLFTRQGLTLGQLSVGLGSRQEPQAQWSEAQPLAGLVVSTTARQSDDAGGAGLVPPVTTQGRLDCVC